MSSEISRGVQADVCRLSQTAGASGKKNLRPTVARKKRLVVEEQKMKREAVRGNSCGLEVPVGLCTVSISVCKQKHLFALQARFLNLWPSDLHCIWHYNQV